MIIYLCLLIILLIASAIKFDKYLYFIIFILLLLVGALRDSSVGTDTISYESRFLWYHGGFVRGIEYGWFLLNKIVFLISGSYQVCIFLSMILVLYPVFFVVRKISNNPLLSITLFYLLYFYFHSFNTTRQSLAGSFILVALYYLLNHDKRKYFIFVCIASLFHTTAILFVLVYPFFRIELDKSRIMIIMIITYFIGAFNIPLLLFKQLHIGSIYDRYLQISVVNTSFSFTRLLLNIMLLCIIQFGDIKNLFVKTLIFGVLILNLFSFSSIFGRFSQYFLLTQILVIPNLKFPFAQKYQKLGQELGLIYALVVFIYLILHNIDGVTPYQLFF